MSSTIEDFPDKIFQQDHSNFHLHFRNTRKYTYHKDWKSFIKKLLEWLLVAFLQLWKLPVLLITFFISKYVSWIRYCNDLTFVFRSIGSDILLSCSISTNELTLGSELVQCIDYLTCLRSLITLDRLISDEI